MCAVDPIPEQAQCNQQEYQDYCNRLIALLLVSCATCNLHSTTIQAKKYGYRAVHVILANRLALFLCIPQDISNLMNRLRVIFHSPVPSFSCFFYCFFFFSTITTSWTRNTICSLIALKMTVWYYSAMIVTASFTGQ